MCGFAAVFTELFVRGDGGAGGDFAFEPGGEGGLGCDLAGGAQAGDDGGGIVSRGVGEVFEIQGWFDGWVGAGEVELSL